MYKLSERPLITAEAIQDRIQSLHEQITHNYDFDMFVSVLTGSFIFVADLCRTFPHAQKKVFFINASSYGDKTKTSGNLKISGMESIDFKGKKILLIDDILDSGRTLKTLTQKICDEGAKEVQTCVLLDKKARREVDFEADFVGFSIQDGFVVGYGLDCACEYRTLPDIWTLESVN